MSRTTTVLLVIVAVLLVVSGHYRRQVERVQMTQLAVQVETLRVEVARTDTIYRDSLRIATRWRERWDTVRVQDTVVIEQVVYVPRAVADSAINACFAVVRSCDRALAARDSFALGLEAQIHAMRASEPPAWRRWVQGGALILLGVGVGRILPY